MTEATVFTTEARSRSEWETHGGCHATDCGEIFSARSVSSGVAPKMCILLPWRTNISVDETS